MKLHCRKPKAHVVDIDDKPYDYQPILNALVDQINSADVFSDKPVIVLMGEDHELAAAQLLQIALLKSLKNLKRQVVYGLEYADNMMASFKDQFNIIASAKTAKGYWSTAQSKRDYDLRSLMMLMDHAKYHYRARFCLAENISVAFNDAAQSEKTEYMLDAQDPSVARALQDLDYTRLKNLPIHRPDIVHTRNLVIARNIVDDIKQRQASGQKTDVYVQMLGAFHVLGQKCDNDIMQHYPYHESVKELLREMGYRVVSFSCLLEGMEIPEEAQLDRTVLVKGWDKSTMCNGFEYEVKRLVHHNRELLPHHTGPVSETEKRHYSVDLLRQVHHKMQDYAQRYC